MNIVLWILQSVLGLLFLYAGIIKSFQPIEKLAARMPWVKDFPVGIVRFIGLTQLLAGLGLIIPQLTGVAPVLSPIAAAGLALTMLLAGIYHARKKEYKALPINATFFALAIFVAIGRGFWE